MTDITTRHEWLVQEIEYRDDYIVRHGSEAADPIEQAQVERFRQEREGLAKELHLMETGASLSLRLHGGVIQSHEAPVGLIKTLYTQFEKLADEFDADVLVKPAGEGSHVIELITPEQMELFEPPEGFLDMARTLVNLSHQAIPDQDLTEGVAAISTEMQSAVIQSVKQIMKALADQRVNLDLKLLSKPQTSAVKISAERAALLQEQLKATGRKRSTVTVNGTLKGFMAGSGLFELDVAGELINGRVPKIARETATGIAIGDQVKATIEVEEVTLPNGTTRTLRRLRKLESLAGATSDDDNT